MATSGVTPPTAPQSRISPMTFTESQLPKYNEAEVEILMTKHTLATTHSPSTTSTSSKSGGGGGGGIVGGGEGKAVDDVGGNGAVEGISLLTNQRVGWYCAPGGGGGGVRGICAGLADVACIEVPPNSMFHKSNKVIVMLKPPTNAIPGGSIGGLCFAFKSSGREKFIEEIQKLLISRPWEKVVKKAPAAITTAHAGVSGLLRRAEEKAKETDQALVEGFKDIEALMAKAKDLVQIANSISAATLAQSSLTSSSTLSSSSSSSTSLTSSTAATATASTNNEFNAILLQLGISSPVTKKSAGSMYHTQLARQLCDFCLGAIAHNALSPIVALPDLYCLINRARGTGALISPEDMYQSCELMEGLNLPMRLRKFPSGVLVLQSAQHDDKAVGQQIVTLIQKKGPVTVVDVAAANRVSVPLAKEQLLAAEQAELLSRDETSEGVVFHLNFFISETPARMED